MSKRLQSVSFLASLVVACSASTPRSLVDARAAYQRATQGPAAQLTPAQLHVAQTYLALAEETYDDEGNSLNARDRAYVAQRKAEMAEVQANIVQAETREAVARKRMEENQAREAAATQQSLKQAQTELAGQRAELAAERQRREEAERRAQEAISQLSKIASVKHEPRGTVITLSGAVIFASGKSDLLPTARHKLDQVADALKQSSPDSTFRVQGYTDSTGPASVNQELSTRRAATVRDYLVSRGVPENRITSEGLGPSNPVADNRTAEGRANNRRVEIVVQSSQQSNASPSTQSQDSHPAQDNQPDQRERGVNQSTPSNQTEKVRQRPPEPRTSP